jgi:uncharacterized protein YecT (DUF1311 family)
MIYTVGKPMKVLFRLSAVFCLGLLAGAVSCRKETKAKEIVNVAQDTMLLRDLAEANRNTANAATMDNSLTTVRSSGDGAYPALANDGSQNRPTTRVATQPMGSEVLTSGSAIKAPTTANDAPAPTTVPVERPALVRAASTDDPCDSPSSDNQRYCLNRAIAANDADLNRTYQDLISQSRKSGGAELEERFRQAQREWVNDRDVACRGVNGSDSRLWARARARCLADYSDRRTAELRRSLNSLRGQ